MKKILAIFFLFITLCLNAHATEKPIDIITSGYSDWSTARLNCKLSSSALPVSATVKIYMERDRSIQISISAIFVGEVGRLEINGTNVLAVNKMKKVYCEDNLSDFFDTLPVTLSDVQNILLGRIFLLSKGVLSKQNEKESVIMEREDGGWDVLPKMQPEDLGVVYGFSTYPDGKTNVALVQGGTKELALEYIYKGDTRKIEVEYSGDGKFLDASLDIKETIFNSYAPLDPVKIKDNWTRVSPKEFLKSLR